MMLLHIWFLRLQGFDDQTDQVQDLVGKVYGGTKELGTWWVCALSTDIQTYLFLKVIPAKHIPLLDPAPLTV